MNPTTTPATPYPVRLPRDLREQLQNKANQMDRSLHWVILKTLQDSVSTKNVG